MFIHGDRYRKLLIISMNFSGNYVIKRTWNKLYFSGMKFDAVQLKNTGAYLLQICQLQKLFSLLKTTRNPFLFLRIHFSINFRPIALTQRFPRCTTYTRASEIVSTKQEDRLEVAVFEQFRHCSSLRSYIYFVIIIILFLFI